MTLEQLQNENRDLKEEIAILQSDLNEALDCTVEILLEKYLKVYYRRKKVFLDTEKLIIKEFLSHVLDREYTL